MESSIIEITPTKEEYSDLLRYKNARILQNEKQISEATPQVDAFCDKYNVKFDTLKWVKKTGVAFVFVTGEKRN